MTKDLKSGEEDVPLLAIKPPETRTLPEELVGNPPHRRKRVPLTVECRDSIIGVMVGQRLKMGAEKVSDTVYTTFVHVKMPLHFVTLWSGAYVQHLEEIRHGH